MKTLTVGSRCKGALLALLMLCAAPDRATADDGPFSEFGGTWSGQGTITLASGDRERLRCQATYRVTSVSATDLDLKLSCQSDNYRFEFAGNARADERGSITGRWTETTRSVGGNMLGQVRGDRVQVLVESSAFSADLLLSTKGGRQTVAIQSRAAGETSRATIALRRTRR